MKSSVLKLTPFQGPRRIQGDRKGAEVSEFSEMLVGFDCLIYTLQNLSPLTLSHPSIKHTFWMNEIWGCISPETVVIVNYWLLFLLICLWKELVIPKDKFLLTPSFPTHIQRTISKYLTRPSQLCKTWLLVYFLVYGGQLTVPLSLLPPSSASRFRECHQYDTTPPRDMWKTHMATGI